MKTAFIGDVHIANHKRGGGQTFAGVNQRAKLALDALNKALALAIEANAGRLVILGDLFDNDRPEPQLIAAVQDVFLAHNIDILLLTGNHDQRSEVVGDHALQPLREQVFGVYDALGSVDFRSTTLLMLPFSRRNTVEYVSDAAKQWASTYSAGKKVLCGHFGIDDPVVTPTYLQGSADSIRLASLHPMMAAMGAHACFTGHWHNGWMPSGEHTDGRLVVQVGALCPTGWDNPGLHYGNVWIYEDADGSVEKLVVPGPRFITDILDVKRNKGNHLLLRLVGGSDEADACRRYLEAGKVFYAECVPDSAQAKEQAQLAATNARCADTTTQALHAYINAMALPEGVTSEEVIQRALTFKG